MNTNDEIILHKVKERKFILAIDASLSSTGYCVVENNNQLVEFNKITTTTKMDEDVRIFTIADKMRELIEKYSISEVVMESQFYSRNAKTALQLSRLRGAITYVVKSAGLNLINRTPSEIRKCLMDDGSASKEEVAKFIRGYFYNDENVQALGELIDRACKAKNSDIYDAIAIGVAHNFSVEKGLE